MKSIIAKYIPDTLIQVGIATFFLGLFRINKCFPSPRGADDCGPNWALIVPGILIAIGLNIAVRRFLRTKQILNK